MNSVARMMMIVVIAAFAAGTVAHAASLTTMTVKMALADAGDAGNAGCAGCGEPQANGMDCDQVCISAAMVLPAAAGGGSTPAFAVIEPAPTGDFAGRTGPPDPYPPRSFVLT